MRSQARITVVACHLPTDFPRCFTSGAFLYLLFTGGPDFPILNLWDGEEIEIGSS